jgi:hypothetical protein
LGTDPADMFESGEPGRDGREVLVLRWWIVPCVVELMIGTDCATVECCGSGRATIDGPRGLESA